MRPKEFEDIDLLKNSGPSIQVHQQSNISSAARIQYGTNALPLKWFIAGASFGLAMDQNLIAPNMTAIANEFGMDNEERDQKIGGELAVAFFLLGAPAAIGIGFASDYYNRRDLLAMTTFLGAIATLGSGVSMSFQHLFISRALAGGAVGGLTPLCMSLLADLYKSSERTLMVSILATISGIGTGTGQNVGGILGPLYGWRMPFIIISIPAFIISICIFCFCEEPKRGLMDLEEKLENDESINKNEMIQKSNLSEETVDNEREEEDETELSLQPSLKNNSNAIELTNYGKEKNLENISPEINLLSQNDNDDVNVLNKSHGVTIRHNNSKINKIFQSLQIHSQTILVLFSTRSISLAYAQGIVGCIPWGVVATFLNDYLAQDQQLGVLTSTMIQTFLGIGGLIGTIIGGYYGQLFYNINPSNMSLFMGIAACIGTFPFIVLLNLPQGNIQKNNSHDQDDQDDQDEGGGSGVFGGGASWQLFTLYLFFAFLTGVCITMTGNCVRSMVQNVTRPQNRGAAFAIFNLSDDVGRGLGPLAVASLVTLFHGDRRLAFSVSALGWLVCGALNCLSALYVNQDVANVAAYNETLEVEENNGNASKSTPSKSHFRQYTRNKTIKGGFVRITNDEQEQEDFDFC